MSKRASKKDFTADFKPLEQALEQGVCCPVERMIVELGITPRNLRALERAAGIVFPWFRETYGALKRHQLVPTNRSWDEWFMRYTLAKKAAAGRCALQRAESARKPRKRRRASPAERR